MHDNMYSMEAVAHAEATRDTTLTAWFKLNLVDEHARKHLYVDIPEHYVFDQKIRKWKPRQRGSTTVIGRMYSVSLASDIERFCLRLLLLHVPGATSFDDCKTVNGTLYQSFKTAAQKQRLLNDDA